MTKHVAIYARYSSDLQNPRSADDQIRICRDFAAGQGWLVTAAFADEGISGSQIDRPGLNDLMARAGSFDLVLAEAVDRLSRDQEDIARIYKRLKFAGCSIVTLADGPVNEVTIGFKGTMSAMFLKDLGDKTRRGQLGVVADGRIPGGNSYGYRRVFRFDDRGRPVRGLREIDDHQAGVIRRIFADYVAGLSPIAIARALNAEGEPSPAGGIWRVSTINGSRQRANGILNNILYTGTIAFNRQRFELDPERRKRVSRPNDRSTWTHRDVPELRIVDRQIWEATEARRAAMADRPFNRQQRPKRLLSGLIRCGQCGGSVSVVGSEAWGCSTAKNGGLCSNRRTIMSAPLERRVIGAIRDQLLDADAVAAYVEEYRTAAAAIRSRGDGKRAALHRALATAEQRCTRLVEAVASGRAGFASIRTALERAESGRAAAEQALADHHPDQIIMLHPAIAANFRARVDRLTASVDAEDRETPAARQRLRDTLRACIGGIVATPAATRGLALEIYATPTPALTKNRPPHEARADPMFQLVAGTGFEPVTFRL